MKIVFMGTPEFACPPLRLLSKSRHKILAVITGIDKKRGRGRKLTQTPVAELAQELNLEVIKASKLRDESLHEKIKSLSPDLIVVIAFRILPESLINIPKLGAINIHGSLLPRYRGAAPINWALINGDKETGLSSFFLKKKVDTGNIILREKTEINGEDNFTSLYNRLSELSGKFLLDSLDKIEEPGFKPATQDNSLATPAPKISPFDALIDFGFPSVNISNFVRGLSEKPGAYSYFRDKKIKLIQVREIEESDVSLLQEVMEKHERPGSVHIYNKKRLLIRSADNFIEILKIIPEGKKEMDAVSFINGFKPESGEIIGGFDKKEN